MISENRIIFGIRIWSKKGIRHTINTDCFTIKTEKTSDNLIFTLISLDSHASNASQISAQVLDRAREDYHKPA